MIILGIDPGSRFTGYGVIRSESNRIQRLDSGVIRTVSTEIPERLAQIYEELSQVVHAHAPDAIAIEKVFVSANAKSALLLGQARGAAICACAKAGVKIFEYTPREIKKSIVGNGAAEKEQVQFMIKALLSLESTLREDESDALACAVTHYQHLPFLGISEKGEVVGVYRNVAPARDFGAIS